MTKPRAYSFKLMSLLSTASLAIAPAAMIGAASVLLTPAVAWADNECVPVGVDPSLNLGDPDTYTCPAGNYSGTGTAILGSGITYNADGNLTINGPSSGTINTGAFGVELNGDTESITWAQTGGTITGTGSGDSTMDVTTTTGAINLTVNAVTGNSVGMVAAIETNTTSGNVTITSTGAVNGRQYGILANHATGGTTTINANGAVSINTTDGIAAIRVNKAAAASATTVNVGTGSGTVGGANGSAIRIDSGGAKTVTIASGRTVSANAVTPGTILLNGNGAKNVTNNGSLSGGNSSGIVLFATGTGNMTLTNNAGATLTGRLALGGVTGTTLVTNNGAWSTAGTSNFGAGTSTLTNSGTLTVGANTVFDDLETFNNSGTIALGSNTLTVADTTFNGTGASLITLNVTNTGNGQLLLPGGTVTGVTGIRVSGAGVSDTSLFSNDPIVLVDVTGGTVADGAFVLDSGSTGFFDDPVLGGSFISEGSLFARAMGVDNNQVVLFSAPSSLAFEYVPAMHQTLAAWHTTTELVTGRNAEVRNRDRGMWVRLIGDRTERDYSPSFTSGGQTMTHDANYTFYTGAAIVGFDVLQGSSASGDYNFGIHGGLVRTRMEFSNSDTTDDMDGVTLGAYGGITNGALTFDGTVNANLLNLDHNEPTLGDTSTNVISIGGRGEAGYLWPMGGSFYVQPLVTGVYVRTFIDELFPKAYEIEYDDVESARLAVGLRIGADAGTAMGPVGFWLTGRLWKEFKDEANVTFSTTGADDFVIVDDLSGEFSELTGGLTLDAGPASLFLSAGAKFYENDEFDNYSGSIGVRWRW